MKYHIRRTKAAVPNGLEVPPRVHFAVKVAPAGNVEKWTGVQSEAGQFEAAEVDRVAAFVQKEIARGVETLGNYDVIPVGDTLAAIHGPAIKLVGKSEPLTTKEVFEVTGVKPKTVELTQPLEPVTVDKDGKVIHHELGENEPPEPRTPMPPPPAPPAPGGQGDAKLPPSPPVPTPPAPLSPSPKEQPRDGDAPKAKAEAAKVEPPKAPPAHAPNKPNPSKK